jgi:hypothetical protein
VEQRVVDHMKSLARSGEPGNLARYEKRLSS